MSYFESQYILTHGNIIWCTKLIHRNSLFEVFLLLELYVQVVSRIRIAYLFFWCNEELLML